MIYLRNTTTKDTILSKEQNVLVKILLVLSVQIQLEQAEVKWELNDWLLGCLTDWEDKKISQPHE